MNQLTDYMLQAGDLLYRYDIKEPPKEWSVEFKNPEYVFPDTGVKNQIGAFFFFNSYHQANNTACCAIRKNGNFADGIWITECTIKETIKLLDLRNSFFCIELLAALDNSGFPIFTDELHSWKGVSFATLADDIRSVEQILLKDSKWTVNHEQSNLVGVAASKVEKALLISNDHIGHLLQLFTDYSNGIYFKSMLKDNGYEGYIFNETNNSCPGTDTVCVFSSEKFYSPSCKRIYLINRNQSNCS